MSVVCTNVRILNATEFRTKARQALDKRITEPPQDLRDKQTWMQCTFKNVTQFPLLFDETHLESGRYWIAPETIEAFDHNVFSVCNQNSPTVADVSGGASFKIVLDEDHVLNVALGWIASENGDHKLGVTESSSARAGYDIATLRGNTILSENQYEARDEDNQPVKIRFRMSAAPWLDSLFLITQIKLSPSGDHHEIWL